MQPDFKLPDFLKNNSAQEIHRRMMNSLPEDIDSMPGGFPYDFTMPAALEKDELINFHLTRALMIAFPQYAWDEWLDLHGCQVHLDRHLPGYASGKVEVTGAVGAVVPVGTVFCTPATDTGPSIEFRSVKEKVIGDGGTVIVDVQAVESGPDSNVAANTVTLMAKPDKNIIKVGNPEPIRGGTGRESNDDYYDRIAMEYINSMTYIGNDADYIRWARVAGAGDCIVIPAAEGPGTVKLVLVDGNGQPANEKLVENVYDYIVSPGDRSARLLPTACAKLICVPATTVTIEYACTGLQYDNTTDISQIRKDFMEAVRTVYEKAKKERILRYNDLRPLMKGIAGLKDFNTFLVNGGMENLVLKREEYPETGMLDFREAVDT